MKENMGYEMWKNKLVDFVFAKNSQQQCWKKIFEKVKSI